MHLSKTIHDWHRPRCIVPYRAIIYESFSKRAPMTVTWSNLWTSLSEVHVVSVPCWQHLLQMLPGYHSLGLGLCYCLTPYQRLRLYNGAPLVAFYDTLGIRRTYFRLKPPASPRGDTTLNSLKVKARYQGHEIGRKSDRLGSNCWSRVRMSFNISERETT